MGKNRNLRIKKMIEEVVVMVPTLFCKADEIR